MADDLRAEYQRTRADLRANGDEPPHGDDDYHEGDGDQITMSCVTLADFAAVDEAGVDALLGGDGEALIPANGDVMVYGDGGAGKTTLCLDLGCHLAAGDNWLTIPIAKAINVLLVENEGPRPLFRAKARAKLAAWAGSPLDDRVRIVDEPWATFTFAAESHRVELAHRITDHDVDVVIVGPLVTSGMLESGTLQEVRRFLALCNDVRHRAERNVTFVLIHHENKGGKVSGSWEGAGDTLIHVAGHGPGMTRVHFQKARWASSWHTQTLQLDWRPGETFAVFDKPDISDDDLATTILAVIASNPGTGWAAVERDVKGTGSQRKRDTRDRLLEAGEIVNVVTEGGADTVINHCPERRRARLHLASDPAITHLCPDSDTDGTQTVLDLG